MADGDPVDLPAPPDAQNRPRIGVDEWVGQVEDRREHGPRVRLVNAWNELQLAAKLAIFVGPAAFLPFVVSSDYWMQVAVITALYAVLAVGLNVAVGFAGLLDLGYVAFFGFGAYAYTWLASEHFDLHWDATYAIPTVVVASAALGFIVGLPSRRLVGDYLAIVTLFFLFIFNTLLLNADRINIPFKEGSINFTRGPNGISTVDPMSFFGLELRTLDHYFWLSLVTFAVVVGALYLLNESRTGRAWRALREDPLAAELMSMPVNRLKLLAFSIGAAAAGLTGSIFAAQNGSVFPVDFDLTLLISLYAFVILGGAGSILGVAIGAVTINVALELLRTPENASFVFYFLLLVAIVAILRRRAAAVLAGIVVLGFLLRLAAEGVKPSWTSGEDRGLTWVDRLVEDWVLLPTDVARIDDVAYIGLIAAVLALLQLRGFVRLAALVPVLYLAVFVWQNVLVIQPSVARYIMLGAMLVALMAARPQGLFGTPRVEIV